LLYGAEASCDWKSRGAEERRLGEKAAERNALRASEFMSELKLRPPSLYEEKRARIRHLYTRQCEQQVRLFPATSWPLPQARLAVDLGGPVRFRPLRGLFPMLGEKSAERNALRASEFMSELKLRPPSLYEEKRARIRHLHARQCEQQVPRRPKAPRSG
jgi:hypothetical protein